MRSRNFIAQLQAIRAPETADTQFAVSHGLTSVDGTAFTPRGLLVARRSHAATLYDSGTAWTSTTAYLKSNTADAQFYVLFFV